MNALARRLGNGLVPAFLAGLVLAACTVEVDAPQPPAEPATASSTPVPVEERLVWVAPAGSTWCSQGCLGLTAWERQVGRELPQL